MSNNSKATEMIRPRWIYLSSDDVPDFGDVSNYNYSLRDPVFAQDGCTLAFGVTEIGFNATATNISRKQENNSLNIKITWKMPRYEVISRGTGEAESKPTVKDNGANYNQSKTEEFTIRFPEGLYSTLDDLFTMMSNPSNYYLPTKMVTNIEIPDNKDYNNPTDIPLILRWQETDGGFSVSPFFPSGIYLIDNEVVTSVLGGGGKILNAIEYTPLITEICILPDPDAPNLYNLLFYNDSANSLNHPPNVPLYETSAVGNTNPPDSIKFTNITFTEFQNVDDPSIDPFAKVNYYATSSPEEDIAKKLEAKFNTGRFNLNNYPFRCYFKPTLNPLYIDVISNMETQNVTTQGYLSGLIKRMFVLGGQNGSTSFHQRYENPTWNLMSNTQINSISISFQSEGEKWNFFNQSFFMELTVFEVEEAVKEDLNQVEEVKPFSIEPDDGLTPYFADYRKNQLRPQVKQNLGRLEAMMEMPNSKRLRGR